MSVALMFEMMGYRRRDTKMDRRCAFCGRARHEVRKLVAGPSVYICDKCISVCKQLLAEDTKVVGGAPSYPKPPKPKDMAKRLDEYVIGQDRAKRVLTVSG